MTIFPKLSYIKSNYKEQQYKMAYTTWGIKERSDKTLFCVHGLFRNSKDFDFIAEYFVKQGYFVVCPDIVGRGESDYLEDYKGYTLENYIKDLLSLIALLDLQNIDFIGFSMGGILGMLLCNIQPTPIKKLVLVDIGMKIESQGLMRIANYVQNNMIFDSFDIAKNSIKENLKTFGKLSEEMLDIIINNNITFNENKKYVYKADPKLGLSIKESIINTDSTDLSPYWNNINNPVLIIRGEISDLLSRETVIEMCKKPNTEAVEIKEAGHAPFLYLEEHFKILEQFFKK